MEESKGGKTMGATQGSDACLLEKEKHLSKNDKSREKSKASEGLRESPGTERIEERRGKARV